MNLLPDREITSASRDAWSAIDEQEEHHTPGTEPRRPPPCPARIPGRRGLVFHEALLVGGTDEQDRDLFMCAISTATKQKDR